MSRLTLFHDEATNSEVARRNGRSCAEMVRKMIATAAHNLLSKQFALLRRKRANFPAARGYVAAGLYFVRLGGCSSKG